jgi:hypothetical protein
MGYRTLWVITAYTSNNGKKGTKTKCRQIQRERNNSSKHRHIQSQGIYVWRNTETRSRNHYYSVKTISITDFSLCVRVHSCLCVCVCMGAGVCLRACSLTNPACNAPSYCHLQPLWLQHIFRHHLIKGMTFGKELLSIKCVLWFTI